MEKITKNIGKGEQISDLKELIWLAHEGKSIVVRGAWGYWVKPAAFMIHWSLCQLSRLQLFYSIKLNN